MPLRIDLTEDPQPEEYQAILAPLRAHNIANAGDGHYQEIALLVRGEDSDEVLGGLYGKLFYEWLFIDLLSVQPHLRGQGIGERLMRMAEELAREKGCIGMYLDTFEFQAPAFYSKLGFVEVGQIADYPRGSRRFFMQKRLAA